MSPSSADSNVLSAGRPTGVRHVVVAVVVVTSVLLYLDRFCVSFAERYIREDLALTETQIAWFLSLFFWAYALGQVPAGWLGDRIGIRGMLAAYILAWSLFTALIGTAAGVISLLVMRLGCGLAQAGAYPASASLLGKWVPLKRRGLASGFVTLGGRAGGAIAPVLTAYLMVLFVPLSTPALLETKQLLNPLRLAAKLAHRESTAGFEAEQRFRQLWPAETANELDEIGLPLRRLFERQAELNLARKKAEASGDAAEVQSVQMDLVLIAAELDRIRKPFELLKGGLNEILKRSDLYRNEDFARLRNLEREAVDLLAQRAAGASLSEQQTIRFNRLLLEAVFPSEIGKLYVRGWRPVVIVYGLVGIVVALLFWLVFRNTPAEHSRCNAAERALIDAGKNLAAAPRAAEPLPIGVILRSRSLWLSSISQFCTNIGWLFLVTFLARYLVEVHEVPILERSWMAAVPPLAGVAGMLLGGQLTDFLTRRIGLRWGRAIPMGVTKLFAAAAYVACLWLDSPWAATIAFAFVFFFSDLGISAIWAFMQDVGGRQVGSMLGWGNMWGNFGAAVAPQIYNAVLHERPTIDEWHTMFAVCAGMLAFAGLAALGIDATVPIEASPDDARGRSA